MYQSELIQKLFEDFQLLKKFKVDIEVKKKMLKELLEAGHNPWRVVGITPNALLLFKEHKFKKVKNIKIQRAHLKNRDYWYGILFSNEWKDSNIWYEFIQENDQTVLALSSENKNINKINYIKFDKETTNLFRSKRITWTHKAEEINFLIKLNDFVGNAPKSVQAP